MYCTSLRIASHCVLYSIDVLTGVSPYVFRCMICVTTLYVMCNHRSFPHVRRAFKSNRDFQFYRFLCLGFRAS